MGKLKNLWIRGLMSKDGSNRDNGMSERPDVVKKKKSEMLKTEVLTS